MKGEAYSRVIVGLGQTGLSVARYLARSGQGFAVVDSRSAPPGADELGREYPEAATHFGDFDSALIREAEQLIVSPGVSVQTPELLQAAEAGTEIVGDIELFARAVKQPVIAITGSNGKSTVTALVGEMASLAGIAAGVGGNIGTPALDLLEDTSLQLHVLELSSFQLETTKSLTPAASVILNISADHMDRYHDLEAYGQAKAGIYNGAHRCIANRDDNRVMALAAGRDCISFGLDEPKRNADYGLRLIDDQVWLVRGWTALMPETDLRIPGRHNTANVLAAMALAAVAGIPDQAMIQAAKNFKGLPHRCAWVAESGGVSWFNDSKGTNVGATLAALKGLQQPVVLIAGGQGKGADFSELRPTVQDKTRAVILFGEDAASIEAAIGDATSVKRVSDLSEAVHEAKRLAQPGDAVLFSPACASFDMFRNYQHRGDTFISLVGEALS